jgi:Response regulators consisting of a CheY-like receiver domain and a winged-helix DNA-binding domain
VKDNEENHDEECDEMRVLVVDDDADVRKLCGINLTWDGHEIISAAGGEEGLELIHSEAPDVVLLDVMMPDVDGLEALRRIRRSEESMDMPVVLISARVGIEDQIEGWAAGADGYITKPFTPSDLTSALNGARSRDPSERQAEREARLRQLAQDSVS